MKISPQRFQEGNRFLENKGWKHGHREFLTHDASFRHYERIIQKENSNLPKSAILMDANPQWEKLDAFIRIARFLKNKGLCVPTIYGEDLQKGFILLEDFGDETFTKALLLGKQQKDLYLKAIDVLVYLHKTTTETELSSLAISKYTQKEALQEVLLFFDWYVPGVLGHPLSPSKIEEFCHLFKILYNEIADFPLSFALRDYHVDNLMILPNTNHTGLLDFQDAIQAPLVYDLVSLLEDARQDISEDLTQELLAYYKNSFPISPWKNEEVFLNTYAFWGLQRNLRILGVFTRLAFRDKKKRYLDYIPRLWSWIEKDLSHPFLEPLRLYFSETLPKKNRSTPSSFWPKQSIILAAGLGKRMHPLTERVPKPLLPFQDDTLLGFALKKVEAISPSQVVINSHYLAEQVKDYIKKKAPFLPFSTTIAYEPTLLETGGGVVNVLPYLNKREPFFVMASDLVWTDLIESPLLHLARKFDPEQMDALLIITPTLSQGNFKIHGYTGPGDFFLEKDGKLRLRGQERNAPYVFPSLQILHPILFEGEEIRSFSLVDIYKKTQKRGRLFGLLIEEGTWFHVGTPEAYKTLQAYTS